MDNTALEMIWLNRRSDIYSHAKKTIEESLGHDYFDLNPSNMDKIWVPKTGNFNISITISNGITLKRMEYIYDFREFVQDMEDTIALEKIK